MSHRHTMGQDWGGRRKVNPENCPKVTDKEVEAKAKELVLEVQRGDFSRRDHGFMHSPQGTWWYRNPIDNKWYTIGATNYWALHFLCNIEEARKQASELIVRNKNS
ncbi:MAG: hypothetical protein WC479_04530 [Candidatus Izemoplasmatales bacterium]